MISKINKLETFGVHLV